MPEPGHSLPPAPGWSGHTGVLGKKSETQARMRRAGGGPEAKETPSQILASVEAVSTPHANRRGGQYMTLQPPLLVTISESKNSYSF